MRSGFDAHLTKPVDPQELLHLLAEEPATDRLAGSGRSLDPSRK
jgi:CheY-like chemotaxis protein